MKRIVCVILLPLLPFLYGQNAVEAVDPLEAFHETAMANMQTQADQWKALALIEKDADKKALYTLVAEGYSQLILLRNEKFKAEKQGLPFHYENFLGIRHRHRLNVTTAEAAHGPNPPQLPPEGRPPQPTQPQATPLPPVQKGYTTPSGFEVKFLLEE